MSESNTQQNNTAAFSIIVVLVSAVVNIAANWWSSHGVRRELQEIRATLEERRPHP